MKPNLDDLKSVSTSISLVLIPIAAAFIGYVSSDRISQRETEGRYVELAVDILRAPPTEKHKDLRRWAVSLINHYSDVTFSVDAQAALVDSVQLPGASTNTIIIAWQPAERAVSYELLIQLLDSGTSWTVTSDKTYAEVPVPAGSRIQWRVRGFDAQGVAGFWTSWNGPIGEASDKPED